MRPINSILVLPAFLLMLLSAGCGSSEPRSRDNLTPIPVKGTVTYKGKPLPTGTVSFTIDGEQRASGKIGPDGTYTVTSSQPGDGAIPGTYDLEIFTPKKGLLPMKYANAVVSRLKITVTPDKTEYPIELE